ncbi:SPOR domain-containing protein [Pseudomonas benzenivorans]|uniref:SPOR domain-containing protein n=1 Tax=Pseudomonas benzenivorans TaxID=556533 RepID=A0ABY5H6Z5_9PSED|nr:SPOR domain-containing protein [Pseudomonas benzenivorans]UTW07383.1 SPOR domain-containing protein [Pseudomonas benzenivorans]
MALLDKGLKQRMVGALVLLALAVIFLPMLLSRQDELRHVVVEAPPMPPVPAMPKVEMQPVAVPEPQVLPEEPLPEQGSAESVTPEPEVAPVGKPEAVVAVPTQPAAPAPTSRLDANGLPISWSVQLASLSSRSGAESLQKTLRSQGYNAYIRSVDGMNRVFVGPLIERAEADRLRDQLKRQHKLNGFVVRFQPERS